MEKRNSQLQLQKNNFEARKCQFCFPITLTIPGLQVPDKSMTLEARMQTSLTTYVKFTEPMVPHMCNLPNQW